MNRILEILVGHHGIDLDVSDAAAVTIHWKIIVDMAGLFCEFDNRDEEFFSNDR